MRLPSDTVRPVEGYPDEPMEIPGQIVQHIKSHLETLGRPFLPTDPLYGVYYALSGRREDD